MKVVRLSIVLVVCTLMAGCAQTNLIEPIVIQVVDCVDQTVADLHNDLRADAAWLRWRRLFGDQPFRHDFASGFRSGYIDVLNGGSGEPPVLPPRRYWRRCYETAQGRRRAQTWFEGYYYGGIAAQQDGAGIWYELPINTPLTDNEPGVPVLPPPAEGEVLEMLPPQGHGPVMIEPAPGPPAHRSEVIPAPEPTEAVPMPEQTLPEQQPPLNDFESLAPPPPSPDAADAPTPEGIPFPPMEPEPEP